MHSVHFFIEKQVLDALNVQIEHYHKNGSLVVSNWVVTHHPAGSGAGNLSSDRIIIV